MSIRKKLLLSHIAMIVIPVLLFGLTAILAAGAYMHETSPGAKQDRQPPFAAMRELFGGRSELASGLTFIAKHDPRLLDDPSFIADTEAELAKVAIGIVLLSGSSTITYASPGLAAADILSRLDKGTSPQRGGGFPHPGPHGAGDSSLARIPFIGADGTSRELVIVSDMEPVARFFRKFIPTVLLTLLGALILTNGILTYIVSRSIIKPLYALKSAAGRIREGDLDHSVQWQRKDEVGQLGTAFEEMRIRLKESIGDKLQLEQNRKELLASISHDLKTPITAIQGCVECLQDGIADTEEKRQKYIGMIAGKTTDMNRMIEELLLYSTLDIGKLPFNFVSLDAAAYMQQAVDELKLNPRMSEIEISWRNDAGRPLFIRADREKLHRALLNIVDNSLKHMRQRPGMLRFELLEEDENTVAIRISDNGTGIPAEALPYVFDQFYRAEPSRSTDAGSSGLGLAIVKQIVHEHGGTVEAISGTEAGTAIMMRFPADRPAPVEKGDQP
ncbi:sensor histidine kinase [Paenibacillus rhizovicinus]|nr:HAMP domain-containing sensor histidine kinase [Paenibacillus rhizovicinus]